MNSRITDVPKEYLREGIVITRPAATENQNLRSFCEDPDNLLGVYNGVTNFVGMRHVGTVYCGHLHDDDPSLYQACGGNLSMPSLFETARSDAVIAAMVRCLDSPQYLIKCDGSCGMNMFASYYTKQEFLNSLFFLMLKQMAPNWKGCNYIDCGQFSDNELRDEEWRSSSLNPGRELGLVAVDCCLWGTMPGQSNARPTKHCGLGFSLVPNMRTLTHGCDGGDKWLQFLVAILSARQLAFFKSEAQVLFGPRQKKG